MNNIYDLGKAGFVIRGQYSSSSTYERLDVVTYDNEIYSAMIDVPRGIVPGTTEAANYWYKMMAKTPVQQQVLDDINGLNGNIDDILGSLNIINNDITNLKNNLNIAFNALSKLMVYADTDITYVSSNKIVGIKLPEGINWGETIFEFVVRIPCNCKGLALENYSQSTNVNSSGVINLEVSGVKGNYFLQDDIWKITLVKISSTSAKYEATLISREKKVVSTEAFIELTKMTINSIECDRFTIHPVSSIGSLKPNITYVFNCITSKTSVNFVNYCFNKTGDSVGIKASNFVGKITQKNLYIGNKPVNGTGKYVGFQVIPFIPSGLYNIDGSNLDFDRYDYDELKSSSSAIFGLGGIQFNSNIPIRFPQFAIDDENGEMFYINDPIYFNYEFKFTQLNKIYVPKNTQLTIALIPRYKKDGTIDALVDDQGNKFYWNVFVYFNEIEKIIYYSSRYAREYDINDDGNIDVTDVSDVIDMVLGINPEPDIRADLNEDGIIDVSDVSKLIDKILGRPGNAIRYTEYPLSALKTPEALYLGNITLNPNRSVAEANAMAKLFKDHEAVYKNYDGTEITIDYSDMVEDLDIHCEGSRKIVRDFWLANRENNETFEEFTANYLNETIISSNTSEYNFVKNLLLVIADIYKEGVITRQSVVSAIDYINGYPSECGQSLEIYELKEYSSVSNLSSNIVSTVDISSMVNYGDSIVNGSGVEIKDSVMNGFNGNP